MIRVPSTVNTSFMKWADSVTNLGDSLKSSYCSSTLRWPTSWFKTRQSFIKEKGSFLTPKWNQMSFHKQSMIETPQRNINLLQSEKIV